MEEQAKADYVSHHKILNTLNLLNTISFSCKKQKPYSDLYT